MRETVKENGQIIYRKMRETVNENGQLIYKEKKYYTTEDTKEQWPNLTYQGIPNHTPETSSSIIFIQWLRWFIYFPVMIQK